MGEVKHLFKQHGPKLGTILVLGEIFTSVVFPYFLLQVGTPVAGLLATLSAAVPSPPYVLASYLYLLDAKEKEKFAKEMSLSKQDFRDRLRLKKDIMKIAQGEVLMKKFSLQLGADQELYLIKEILIQQVKKHFGDNSIRPAGFLELVSLEKISGLFYNLA